MKRIFVIVMIGIVFSVSSCGNQSKQPTANTPTAPDSAISNGTEGTIGSDTGVGTGNSSSNNKYDTSKNDSIRKDSNKKY